MRLINFKGYEILQREAHKTTPDKNNDGTLKYTATEMFRLVEKRVLDRNDDEMSYDMLYTFRQADLPAHQKVILGQEHVNIDICLNLAKNIPNVDYNAIRETILNSSPTPEQLTEINNIVSNIDKIKSRQQLREHYDR